MRTALLAGLVLAMLPATAAQPLTPLYDAELTQPIFDYVSQAITLQTAETLNEGILPYAERVIQGDKVTIVSSNLGLAIYVVESGQYRLVSEFNKTELGLNDYDSIGLVKVADNDAWFMYLSNGNAVSIALDAQYQPLLSSRSSTNVGYTNMYHIGAGYAAFSNGSTLKVYNLNNSNGVLSAPETLQLDKHPSHLAIANNTLAISHDYYNEARQNLKLYQRNSTGQWQFITGHIMNHNQYGHHSVDYLTISADGQQLVYGNDEQVYGLNFDAASAQLTEAYTGVLPNHYNDTYFVDSSHFLARNYQELALINSQSLQKVISYNLNSYLLRDISSGASSTTLLGNDGLRQLSTLDLIQQAHIAPGQLEVMLNLSDQSNRFNLTPHFMLQRGDGSWDLFKLNESNLPQLTQRLTTTELLGYDQSYNEFASLNLGNNLFAILQGNRYSVIKLDEASGQLQLLKQGTLQFPNEQNYYISYKTTASLNNNVLVANGNSMSLFQLTSDNQLQFVDAVVNGASGVSGIANVQMVFTAGNHIYTADQTNQSISHFAIENSRLQQKNIYSTNSFPALYGVNLHDDVITLRSINYLQTFRQQADGSLILLTNQFMRHSPAEWTLFGKRFATVREWENLHVYELNSHNGSWLRILSLANDEVQQQFNVRPTQLVSLDNQLGIYDSNSKKLVKLSHNSAPTVSTPDLLQLSLHQGKTYQLALNSVFTDDEADAISFGLLNAANNFALTDTGVLTFDGQLATVGSLDITATDTAGLASIAKANYQINLAPVAKAAAPTATVAQGDALQFELAPYYTDPEGQALHFTLTSVPAGVNLSAAGLITGKLNTVGMVDVSFSISDSAGAVSSHSMQINVTAKAAEPEKSSGGSLHWLLLSLLAALTLPRTLRKL